MKRCTKCFLEKPADSFYKNAKSPTGFQVQCKSCQDAIFRPSRHKAECVKARGKYSAAYDKKRRAEDPVFRLRKRLRERINSAIRKSVKAGSAIKDLGCSIPEFKSYLEGKFLPGMTWDSKGLWHIDHIKPLKHFNLCCREEFLKACHYTNLQPLWASDNLKKGAKCG